jgi:hypothetical protein
VSGPDGYIGAFYSKCWDIVKGDVIAAILQITQLRGATLNQLNMANIVLLPQKEQAEQVGDFRPISLVHNVAKIFYKILANRLAPRLPELVYLNQSAFVKKRYIHDNFIHVQGIITKLHKMKNPTLFLKLDIAKAFDSISWAYLFEVLQKLGFGAKWRDWISLALSTSSSRVMLNGTLGKPLKHERGLRQGDLISPLLFILAMDPLQKILYKVAENGILQPIGPRERGIKISLYADDAAIFVKPSHNDILAL